MERGKAKGRLSVRRLQMKLLERGNATMGVWLGKQLLGQVDQIDHHVQETGRVLQVICIPKSFDTPAVAPIPPAIISGVVEAEHVQHVQSAPSLALPPANEPED